MCVTMRNRGGEFRNNVTSRLGMLESGGIFLAVPLIGGIRVVTNKERTIDLVALVQTFTRRR